VTDQLVERIGDRRVADRPERRRPDSGQVDQLLRRGVRPHGDRGRRDAIRLGPHHVAQLVWLAALTCARIAARSSADTANSS